MKSLRLILTISSILLLYMGSSAQTGVSINASGAAPDAQAILDISSNTKGALLPRMTTAEATTLGALLNATDDGMIIYDTDLKTFKYWDGVALAWQEIPNVANTGNTLDEAYDEDTPGAGRIIVADAGAVDIQGSGGLLVNGRTGIGTSTPDAAYQMSVLNSNNSVKVAGTNIGVRVEMQGQTEDGVYASNSSIGTTQAHYAVRGELSASATNGYLGYSNSSGVKYAVYGTGGAYAGYFNGDINLTGEIQLNGSAGTAGQVLMSAGSGFDAVWGTAPGDIESVTAGNALTGGGTSGPVTLHVAADNGLNVDVPNDKVQLGGPLTEATNIALGANSLTFNLDGTGELIVQDGGVDHFKVDAAGDAFFGSDTYFKDTNTGGTDLVKISDAGVGGNDGLVEIFKDGAVNHTLHGDGDVVFNDLAGNRDLRIESVNQANMFFLDASADRVGLGTASPAQTLHVVGNTRVTGLADPAGAVVTSNTNGDLTKVSLTGSTSDVLLGNGTFGPGSSFADHDWYQTGGTSTPTAIGDWIYTNGNVGINTGSTIPTNPLAALHVQSNIYVGDYNTAGFYNSNANIHVARTNNPHILMEDIGTNTGGLALDLDGLSVVSENADIDFKTGVTFNGSFSSTGNSRMIIKNAGNVGIGTITPDAGLNVGAAAGAIALLTREDAGSTVANDLLGSLHFDSTDDSGPSTNDASAGIRAFASEDHGSSNKGGYMTFFTKPSGTGTGVAASERLRIAANGNIGIGNNAPVQKLHVGAGAGDGVMVGNHNDQLGWNGTGAAPQLSIRFAGYRDVVGNFTGAKIAAVRTDICCSGLSQGTELAFSTQETTATVAGDGNLVERVRIGNGGNLGVGTSVPAEKLHVVGNARISGLASGGNVQADGSGNLIISNDIPGGDGDYIQNQTAGAQAGAGFYTAGSGRTNGTLTGGGATVISADNIQVNDLGTGNRYAYLDLEGDATYTDFGLRLIRNNGGANTSSQMVHRGTGDLNLTAQEAAAMTFATTNTERMRIQAGGTVGIGLTNPGAKLTVRNNATDPGTYDDGKALFVSGTFGSGQAADGGIEFRHDNLTQGIGFGYNTIYQTGTNANEVLNLIAKGTGAITLQAYNGATGNVGIGLTNPTAKLHVSGDFALAAGNDGMLKVKSVVNPSGCCGTETVSLQTSIDNRTDAYTISGYGGDYRHVLSLQPEGGRVGVGMVNPGHTFQINGDMKIGVDASTLRTLYFGDASYIYLQETADDYLTIEASNGTRIGSQGTYTKDMFHGVFTVGDNNAGSCGVCAWSGWGGNVLEIQVNWASLGIPNGTNKTVILTADGNNNTYTDTWNVALQQMFSNRMDILIDRTDGGGWGLTTMRIHYVIMNND